MEVQKVRSGLSELRRMSRLLQLCLALCLLPSLAQADNAQPRGVRIATGASPEMVDEVDLLREEPFDEEAQTLKVSDPIESVNRGIFWLNDTLDIYLLEPIAKGYDSVVPDIAQESIANFFDTLRYPMYLFSDLITLDGERTLVDSARFGINATIGFLGFFDVADQLGFDRKATDAGVAFGRWGIPEGPYVVLPILGASNVRDTVGEVFNFFLDPLALVQFSQMSNANRTAISSIGGTTRTINRRSQMIPNVTSAKQASLDYYLFVQSAYAQYRRGLIQGEESSERALFDARVESD